MLRDHVGSVRAAFDVVNDSVRIVDASHYYPFGLHIDSLRYHISPGADENEYAYNGKEWQNEGGFNQYDYGARMYDPAIGRWWVVDPLAEFTSEWTTYVFVGNSPVIFTDIDGRTWLNKSDEQEANNIDNALKERQSSLESNISNLENRRIKIEKRAAEKGWSEEKLKGELAEIDAQLTVANILLDHLSGSRQHIAALGATDKYVFTFKDVTSEGVGGITRRENGVIQIGHGSNLGNKVHEVRHAFDLVTGEGIMSSDGTYIQGNTLEKEADAYRYQFAADPESFLPYPSPPGTPQTQRIVHKNGIVVKNIGQITVEWVKGILVPDKNGNFKPLYQYD